MKKVFWFVALAFSLGLVSCEDDDNYENSVPVLEDSDPSVEEAGGFYVVNEGWFGHDMGSVNYAGWDGSLKYYVYNDLGNTTQFGTVWGDYVFLVSKQGKRLSVVDEETWKEVAAFDELGGDGRSFVGVDDETGYVGTANGLVRFDVKNLQLGEAVEGVNGQMGSLISAKGYVFAVTSEKLYIVDVAANKLKNEIEGEFYTSALAKDGTVWVAGADGFLKIDPETLEQENVAYPDESMKVVSPWSGGWNAGTLCASTQENVLYWATGQSTYSLTGVVKYDINKKTFDKDFYTLGKDEEGKEKVLYGAGLRVDPLTDRLVITAVRTGWGDSYSYNWFIVLNADGSLYKEYKVLGGGESQNENYYWFPALPMFEDANAPEILINQILVSVGETKEYDLSEKMVDADNISSSMIRRVEFADNDLLTYEMEGDVLVVKALKAGSTTCKMTVISNGKRVEKDIRVDITE